MDNVKSPLAEVEALVTVLQRGVLALKELVRRENCVVQVEVAKCFKLIANL